MEPVTFAYLDWVAVETAMSSIHPGIEFAVSARCRIQDIEGTIVLAYARVTCKQWRFCDENRVPVIGQPDRVQRLLWQLLPDLLAAINEEAISFANQLEAGADVLRRGMRLYRQHETDERSAKVDAEMDELMGLS